MNNPKNVYIEQKGTSNVCVTVNGTGVAIFYEHVRTTLEENNFYAVVIITTYLVIQANTKDVISVRYNYHNYNGFYDYPEKVIPVF